MNIQKLFERINIRNTTILSEYLEFCKNNQEETGDRHHILPCALFPEYSNLEENRWNCAVLSPNNHYIAHAMLSEALNEPSMDFAWYAMNNKNYKDDPVNLIGPEKHSELMKKRNEAQSERMKTRVMALNTITGENVQVTKKEFDSSEHLVGITTGRGGDHLRDQVSILIDGQAARINKEDFDPSIHTGLTKGKTMYKDKDGNTFQTTKDDPRVISGELVGIQKGKKFDFPIVECPHCGKKGKKIGGMLRFHFDNCKKIK